MSGLLQNPLAQALAWTLLHFLWEGAVLGLAAWAGLWLLRHRSANARYLLACLALGLMLAAAVLTFVLLRPLFHSAEGGLAGAASSARALDPVAARAALAQTPWAFRTAAVCAPVLPWALGLWSLGVAGLTFRLVGAWLWLQRLRYSGVQPAGAEFQARLNTLIRRLRVDRAVRLLRSAAVEAPVVIGWLRPVILVPVAAFTGLTPEALDAVLAHELAHIRRHDYLVNLLQSAVEILFFYHPAVWWVSAQIRNERENACDDVAVASCGDALLYARSLTRLEELRSEAQAAVPELALASNGGSLMNRIRRILLPPLPPSNTARAGLIAALAFSLAGAATTYRITQAPTPKADESKARERTRVVLHGEHNLNVNMDGDVKLEPGAKEMVKLGPGGSLELKGHDGGKVKKFTARKDAKGETREWSVDGKATPMTPQDEAWLRDQLKYLHDMKRRTPPPGAPGTHGKKIVIERDGDTETLDMEGFEGLEDLPTLQGDSTEHRREVRKIVIDAKRLAKEAQGQAWEALGQAHEAEVQAREAAKRAKDIQIIVKKHRREGEAEHQIDIDMDRLGEEMGRLGERMGEKFRVSIDGDELPPLREGGTPRAEGAPRMRTLRLRGKEGEGLRRTEIEVLQREIERLKNRLDRLQKLEATPGMAPLPPMPPAPPMMPTPPAPPAPPEAPAAHGVPPPPPPPPPGGQL